MNYPYISWNGVSSAGPPVSGLLGQYTLKPSPVLGAASSIRCTDEEVGKIQDDLTWNGIWTDIVSKRAKELRDDIGSIVLSGTSPIITGIMKEKEMEIGGEKCHLCGSEILYSMNEDTFHKKYVAFEKRITYQCGTSIHDSYRERHFNPRTGASPEVYKKDRHIHAECI